MADLGIRPFAALALLALWLLVWLPRRVIPARGLALFRCLLPSWRFFEQLAPTPMLEYRLAPIGEDWGEWREALTVPHRTATSLLWNAAGNLNLACQSLVEHLVVDLDEASELGCAAHELVSYRLVCALIEQQLPAAPRSSPPLRYQFRLAEGPPEEPLFVSDVHAAA